MHTGSRGKEGVVKAAGAGELSKRGHRKGIKGTSTERGNEKKWSQQRPRRNGQRVSVCVPESKGRKSFKERSEGEFLVNATTLLAGMRRSKEKS